MSQNGRAFDSNCNCSTLTGLLEMAAATGSVLNPSTQNVWKYNDTVINAIHTGQSVGSNEQCFKQLRRLVLEANRDMWMEMRQQPEYLASADVYSVVILCLFASIIVMLMVRAIKPSETLDDQVTILLNSMRVRVEFEDNARQKQKLMEAKRKAQRWLADAKMRGVKKLSFRRNTSNSESASADAFVPSTPTPMGSGSTSFQGNHHLSTETVNSSYHQTISIHSVQSTQSAAVRSSNRATSKAKPPAALRLSMGNLGIFNLGGFGINMPSPCPSSNATPTPLAASPFHSPASVVPRERCNSSLSNSMRHFFNTSTSPNQAEQIRRPHYLNQRAASYQFLPEIVVTTNEPEMAEEEDDSSSSRQFSRASSSQSVSIDDGVSQESLSQCDIVFDV